MPLDLCDDPRPGGIILPRYDGRSILNVPASVCAALGVPPPTDAPPLDPAVLPPAMLQGVSAVILLVVDGLGWDLLQYAVYGEEYEYDVVGELALRPWLEAAKQGSPDVAVAEITSVFPSSTMPALATLNTGLAPAQHGLMGWTTYLEELGEAAELARWGPAGGRGSYQHVDLGMHDPVEFFGRRTLHQHLRDHGVQPSVVCPISFRGSGYSDMIFHGARFEGYHATSTMPLIVKDVLDWCDATDDHQQRFVYAYWPTVDTVEHHARRRWGLISWDHQRLPDVKEEIAALDFALGRHFREGRAGGSTLLLITSDHGHVFCRPREWVRFDTDDTLMENLLCAPTGERRLVYLHAKPGRADFVRAYCEQRYARAAHIVQPDELFARGLFGPGELSPAARRRAGDLVLVARGEWQLMASHRPGHDPVFMYGNHGGLDPREMLVPLIAVRL